MHLLFTRFVGETLKIRKFQKQIILFSFPSKPKLPNSALRKLGQELGKYYFHFLEEMRTRPLRFSDLYLQNYLTILTKLGRNISWKWGWLYEIHFRHDFIPIWPQLTLKSCLVGCYGGPDFKGELVGSLSDFFSLYLLAPDITSRVFSWVIGWFRFFMFVG